MMVRSATPTLSVAVLLVAPVPASFEVTAPVVLFLAPLVVAVTLTEKVHELPAASVPPLRLTEPVFAVAVTVPLQLPLKAFGVETTMPAGRVSLKATPVSADAEFGLEMVKLRVEAPFTATLCGEKPLLIVGGAITVRVAVLLALPVPRLEVSAPVMLFFVPAVVPVTFTEIAQRVP